MGWDEKGDMSKKATIKAARNMDWQQVVLNGGPPCFHLENTGRFCGRAERWEGHKPFRPHPPIHKFVSLADLLKTLPTTKQA